MEPLARGLGFIYLRMHPLRILLLFSEGSLCRKWNWPHLGQSLGSRTDAPVYSCGDDDDDNLLCVLFLWRKS